jgi:hypothetical protein
VRSAANAETGKAAKINKAHNSTAVNLLILIFTPPRNYFRFIQIKSYITFIIPEE